MKNKKNTTKYLNVNNWDEWLFLNAHYLGKCGKYSNIKDKIQFVDTSVFGGITPNTTDLWFSNGNPSTLILKQLEVLIEVIHFLFLKLSDFYQPVIIAG